MNSITTKATAASPKSSVAPPAGRRWMTVVFMQGEEADTVLDMIDRNGPEAAIHHLSRSDYGDKTRDAALDNGYVYDEVPESPTDRVVHDNVSGYALMYTINSGMCRSFATSMLWSRSGACAWRHRSSSDSRDTGVHAAPTRSDCEPHRQRIRTGSHACTIP